MEYVDVLDENGIRTGEIVSREEAHRTGKWHRAIIVAIVNGENKVLIQKRSEKKKKRPGMWDISVAGHVSAGQDSLSASMREVSEEVKVDFRWDIAAKDFRYMFSYRCQEEFEDGTIENQFYDVFIMRETKIETAEKVQFQEEEVSEVRLVSPSELDWMINNDSNFVHRPIYETLINYLYRY